MSNEHGISDPTSSPPVAPDVTPSDPRPEQGIALCLSGGGFRAMLFHLGSIWRLNECGLLTRIQRVSSVSGGSITAATLGLHWPELEFDPDGVASNFSTLIVEPVRQLAGHTIDVGSVFG